MSVDNTGLPDAEADFGTINVPGATLPYWDTAGHHAAVILLHGKTGSWRSWQHQVSDLSRSGFRVIGYSRRGHDGSSHTTPGTGADDLLALLDHLGIGSCHVVGHAAGGVYALDFALSYQTRVRSLTIACSTLGVREPDFERAVASLQPTGLADLPASFCELSPSYRITHPDGVDRWSHIEAGALTGEFIMQGIRSTMTWSAVEALGVRTLLIAGESDLYMPPPLADRAAGHFSDITRVTIPRSGHNPQWERPADFNRALISFFAS